MPSTTSELLSQKLVLMFGIGTNCNLCPGSDSVNTFLTFFGWGAGIDTADWTGIFWTELTDTAHIWHRPRLIMMLGQMWNHTLSYQTKLEQFDMCVSTEWKGDLILVESSVQTQTTYCEEMWRHPFLETHKPSICWGKGCYKALLIFG